MNSYVAAVVGAGVLLAGVEAAQEPRWAAACADRPAAEVVAMSVDDQVEYVTFLGNCRRLYNACRPVRLGVSLLGDDAKEIGLRRERIMDSLEARLRGLRLFQAYSLDAVNDPNDAMFSVEVQVFRQAFHVEVSFSKELVDPRLGVDNLVHTSVWSNSIMGIHGGSSAFVGDALTELVDGFILDYLRVNEPACGGPGDAR